MKKEIEVCDECFSESDIIRKTNIASYKCSLCGKDICWNHAKSLDIRFYWEGNEKGFYIYLGDPKESDKDIITYCSECSLKFGNQIGFLSKSIYKSFQPPSQKYGDKPNKPDYKFKQELLLEILKIIKEKSKVESI